MDVGIGLPGSFRGVRRDDVLGWAARADEAGFSSVSTGERLAFANHDLLVMMAMVAATVRRARIMTTVMILPLHNAALVAKQAASLDVLTEGRFSLGVGTGVPDRVDDFTLAGVVHERRGAILDEQLTLLRSVWRGEAGAGGDPIGPAPATPGGPEVLVGGWAPRAMRRAARHADGIVTFTLGTDVDTQAAIHRSALDAWAAEGRDGRPRWVAGMYFALGPDPEAAATPFLDDYYRRLAPDDRRDLLKGVDVMSDAAAAAAVDAFAAAGADELFFSPMVAGVDQVDRLAQAVEPTGGNR